MADLEVGTVIGGLRIDGVAGRGGMGVVYRATQLALNRRVAMKVVTPQLADDPEFRERFKRESELAASIDHPHVVPIFHAGEEDGLLYVSMRFVEGTDLRELILQRGRLEPAQAAEIVSQVAGALDAAHARGLVHRDVKPANILIGLGGADATHAYLTDFGLTKQVAAVDGLTRAGAVLGTMDYIAPEQLEGHAVDGRADVYALGCVLYEALTGMVPFPRDSEAAKMWAHIGQRPPMLREVAPNLPQEMDDVLQRAMSKQPAQRFSSAGELGRAAVEACGVSTASSRAVSGNVTVTGARPVGWAGPGPGWPAAPESAPGWPAAAQSTPGWPAAADPVTNRLSSPGAGQSHPSLPGATAAWSGYGGYQPAYAPPLPLGPRRSALPLVLGIVGVLVVAALGAGLLAYADRTPPPPPPPVAAGEIVGSPVVVGAEPASVVAGGGFLWTLNAASISRIDPATGTSTEVVVDGVPYDYAVDQGSVWVLNYADTIVGIDLATAQVSDPIPIGSTQVDYIAGGGGYIWLLHSAEGTISRLNLATRQLEGEPVAVGSMPQGMAFSDGFLYVVNVGDQTLVTLDGTTGQLVGTPLPIANANGSLIVSDGRIYLGTPDDTTSQITPVDERSLIVGDPIPLKGGGVFAVGAGSVWLAYPVENVIRRFDLLTFEPRGEPIRGVGKGLNSLNFINGTLLAVNGEDGTVVRIRPTP